MLDFLGLNTVTIAAKGAAAATSAFVRHYLWPSDGTASNSEARKELLFDEAFSIAKAFLAKATLHTVEDVQHFGNTFVPSPWWTRVIRVVIPSYSRLEAARILIETLGEKEIDEIAGGREWWQRTAHPEAGINGEWISMKKDWKGLDGVPQSSEDRRDADVEALRELNLKDLKDAAAKRAKKRVRRGKRDQKRWQKEQARLEKAKAKASLGVTDGGVTTDDESEPGDDESDSDDDDDVEGNTKPSSGKDDSYTAELDEQRCLLYIHGGAYFFGSPNTHRYSIWRFARKIKGRAFAVQYRLCPQYPWPCALADALASYLYLIKPPPGAKHKPVDPARLTLAGDSAGGGLCLSLLCLIRDSGLPMPAGAALISPWCDLTHSFPSCLENTSTDIIPPYSFIFKPSTLWPPPPVDFQKRADKQTSLETLMNAQEEKRKPSSSGSTLSGLGRSKGKELASKTDPDSPPNGKVPDAKDVSEPTEDSRKAEAGTGKDATAEAGKYIEIEIDGKLVQLRDQIQLYATNEQLTHPFVSPVFQPSLGGLCPLYVLAGDSEVLRDEIIYMAHRAANPSLYPLRQGLLDANPERTARSAHLPPTKVHLQVFDGICHDLTLFSFTVPAKYAYRAIASFIKSVTTSEAPPSPVSINIMPLPAEQDPKHPDAETHKVLASEISRSASPVEMEGNGVEHSKSPRLQPGSTASSTSNASGPAMRKKSSTSSRISNFLSPTGSTTPGLEKTIYSSTQPFNRPAYVHNMIRERVSVAGVVRAMEPAKEMSMLCIPPEELGLIKEAAVKRYLAGKAIWDKKFKRAYARVQRHRERNLQKSIAEEGHRIRKRLQEVKRERAKRVKGPLPSQVLEADSPGRYVDSPMQIKVEGIWELHGERPPPSSIAARKDTREARRLAHVLDEHYSVLGGLGLWTKVQEIGAFAPLSQSHSVEGTPAMVSTEALDVAEDERESEKVRVLAAM